MNFPQILSQSPSFGITQGLLGDDGESGVVWLDLVAVPGYKWQDIRIVPIGQQEGIKLRMGIINPKERMILP